MFGPALGSAGHGEDLEGPLFWRVLRGESVRAHLHPQAVDRILKKYVKKVGIRGRYSAHSMRAGLHGRDGARRLRQDFERVLLNQAWVE